MAQKNTEKVKKSVFREYAEALLCAVILALVIRTFIFQAFTIPSASMEKTLLIGDYLLVSKFIYGIKNPLTGNYIVEFGDPELGDIIVFRYPLDEKQDYVKRVVGLPGDTIEVRDKQLYRNGVPVEESYIQHIRPDAMGKLDNIGPLTVPDGHYFGMGDNRDNSSDSREWGTVDRNLIHGKAWRLYWSWDKNAGNVRWGRLGDKLE